MFPKMRQRLIIAAAVVAGAGAWLLVKNPLLATDGDSGISLFSARIGLSAAMGLVMAAGLPAVVLGLIASATGNPLSGVFATAAALGVLAGAGGPIDGWMRRARLPGDYLQLIFESLIWLAGLVVMLAAIQVLRSPIRVRWPALAFDDHLGLDTHLRFPQLQSLCAGIVSASIGGVMTYFLIRSSDGGQVIWGLFIAFTLGGLAGQMFFPQNNPAGILFSPALTAVVAYAFVMLRFHSQDQILEGWFNAHLPPLQRLPSLALALPIHYASAGVAGAALGVGWAQALASAQPSGEAAT